MTKVIKGMQWWCHLTAVYGREEQISIEVVMWFQLCHPCGFLWHGKLHDVSSATNSAGLSCSGDIAFLLLLFMNWIFFFNYLLPNYLRALNLKNGPSWPFWFHEKVTVMFQIKRNQRIGNERNTAPTHRLLPCIVNSLLHQLSHHISNKELTAKVLYLYMK